MGEVLYRWLFVKRQEIVPGAFLFSNRHRTGFKTGGQLPGLVFPDGVKKMVSESEKIVPVSLENTTLLIIENHMNEKRWQRFVKSTGSVIWRH